MNKYFIFFLLLFSVIKSYAKAQQFNVTKAPFCSGSDDEFSPVYYKNGIVFCSNRPENLLISYKDRNQKNLFKIYYIEKKDSQGWKHANLLSKDLTSSFNDGPATFNETGNIIHYARNNFIEKSLKNINNESNRIGIFSAEFVNGKWDSIRPFPYNNPLYSFGTPALTPNGDRLYFSSDMPDGFGGMDLYYCDRYNNGWGKPVNMGPLINTPKNESFPFVNKSDKVFFASDGHTGFGGKDIYYTREINGKWIAPVHLDSAINSTADDFGLVTDSVFENGYFSSNRLKSDDIFSFSLLPLQFEQCDTVKENNYCFTFYDELYQNNDSTDVTYSWDFGNGIIRNGKEVNHCFPGPGHFKVLLSIKDSITGLSLVDRLEYSVDLEDINHAYINSFNVGIVGKPINFKGIISNYDNSFSKDYYWNFGSGFIHGNENKNKVFNEKGKYFIKLGVRGIIDSIGNIQKLCVGKKIRIYQHYHKLKSDYKEDDNTLLEQKNSDSNSFESLQIRLYLMDDLSEAHSDMIKKILLPVGKLEFNSYGIMASSNPYLNKIVEILKTDSNIKIEMYVHNLRINKSEITEISEKWAQELSFFFRNKELNRDAYYCRGFGISNPVFEPFIPDNDTKAGFVDFIFRSIK